MRRILPPNKRLQYKLRPRNHNFTLSCKNVVLWQLCCNFITRMLFRVAYWLHVCFTAVLLRSWFVCVLLFCVSMQYVCHWFNKLFPICLSIYLFGLVNKFMML